MGLLDIFKTSDGSIPYLQILLGIIVGIIGTILYHTFYKPIGGNPSQLPLMMDIEPTSFTTASTSENFSPTLIPPQDLPSIPETDDLPVEMEKVCDGDNDNNVYTNVENVESLDLLSQQE